MDEEKQVRGKWRPSVAFVLTRNNSTLEIAFIASLWKPVDLAYRLQSWLLHRGNLDCSNQVLNLINGN